MKVFINPGHDQVKDPGACGNGIREATYVARIGELVSKYLTRAGVQVVGLVQNDDLHMVCALANNSDCDLFISIHCNAAKNPEARGTETYAHSYLSKGKTLADFVQMQIVTSCDTLNRGVKFANFYVLKHTFMPAILVELAFVSNESDAGLLKKNQENFARAIARGVTDYELYLKLQEKQRALRSKTKGERAS